MKKLVLTLLGVAFAAGSAFAQAPVVARVDVAKLRAAITKSDADIADAKKNTKAATWVTRGEVFVEADTKPVNGVFAGMSEDLLKAAFGGNTTPQVQRIGSRDYNVYTFEHLKAYVTGGVVSFYTPVTVIDPNALEKAYEAFDKAYQMDPKTIRKVAAGMENIHTKAFEDASALYSLGEYVDAAEAFRMSYRASSHATQATRDTLALYYAGMSAANGRDFQNAIRDIDQALAMGFESDGEAYQVKFQAQYNLDQKEASLETLKTGISRFPNNELLIDMILRYYAENEGDPSSVIPLVQSAIDRNPSNPMLYQGMARVQNRLGQHDTAIETMKKAVQLAPDNFASNYYEGFFIVQKGDAMTLEIGNQPFTSAAQNQAAYAAVNDVFRSAIAPLEKAHEIDPTHAAPVELLKGITFRLRDEPGMTEKFEKYDALLNTLVQ